MNIEILNNQKKIKIDKKKIKRATAKFLRHLKQRKDCILNLAFVSPGSIRQVNKKYFKRNRATDVIAIEPGRFNRDPECRNSLRVASGPRRSPKEKDSVREIFRNYLGDIILCPQKAKENSKRFGTSTESEVLLYIAHGILHLLHYDDLNKIDRLKMEKKQQELMAIL